MGNTKNNSEAENTVRNGWIAVSVSIACVLISIGVAVVSLASESENAVPVMRVWCIIAALIPATVIIAGNRIERSYRRKNQRNRMTSEREKKETLDIMQALCANFNAVFYCDYLKNELKLIQRGQKFFSKMPEEYNEQQSLDEYVKTYCDRAVAEEYKEDFIKNVCPANIAEKLKDRDYYTYTYVGIQDGKNIFYRMMAAKVNNSENHFVVGFADVDDEVRDAQNKEEILKDALTQAEKANQIKTDFLSKMTSDLMSPIKGIISAAKAIEEKTGSSSEEADVIISEAESLETRIDVLLDIGSIRENKLLLDSKAFDINEALTEVEEMANHRRKHKDVDFVSTRQIVHDAVIGDCRKLVDMVKHVAIATIDMTPTGGTIHGSIIETQVINRKAFYDISIDIVGKPFDEGSLKKIFEDEADEENEFTGLAIARILAELVGGKMEITETQDGTSIKLHLSYYIKSSTQSTNDTLF